MSGAEQSRQRVDMPSKTTVRGYVSDVSTLCIRDTRPAVRESKRQRGTQPIGRTTIGGGDITQALTMSTSPQEKGLSAVAPTAGLKKS